MALLQDVDDLDTVDILALSKKSEPEVGWKEFKHLVRMSLVNTKSTTNQKLAHFIDT